MSSHEPEGYNTPNRYAGIFMYFRFKLVHTMAGGVRRGPQTDFKILHRNNKIENCIKIITLAKNHKCPVCYIQLSPCCGPRDQDETTKGVSSFT